ncbi:MAG: tryptophan--tRNA ligase [Actinobacteria bacterium]|nr:tryptophan--tRNA ligase [Actinomycetota bacterium]
MTRVFSGVQPSGDMHIGNYLGAFRQWVEDQHSSDAFYCIVDLHALTVDTDPEMLRSRTVDAAINLLAVGLDPQICTIFVQSHVPEHAQLSWLLECMASMGELRRMTQFKEKGAGRESVRVGLFTYPVLMTADILLYDAERVPVGDDQRQHLELARNLAIRFNNRYGDTFVVPAPSVPRVAARVMDLQDPTQKMSKSSISPTGTVAILDSADQIEKKVRRAVTDPGKEVVYDPVNKPGISNLLDILAAVTGKSNSELATEYHSYAQLKSDVAEALIELLRPIQQRHAQLSADPGEVLAILARGAERAQSIAAVTLERAANAMGLLPPKLI